MSYQVSHIPTRHASVQSSPYQQPYQPHQQQQHQQQQPQQYQYQQPQQQQQYHYSQPQNDHPVAHSGFHAQPNTAQVQQQSVPHQSDNLEQLRVWFRAVDQDHSGSISAAELKTALVNADCTMFNDETIRLMMNLFDRNQNGSIDFQEFCGLWKFINEWKVCFVGFDTDGSGSIDRQELQQAFHAFGYRLSPKLIDLLIRKYDHYGHGDITFDAFIQTCVTVKSLTDSFLRFDTDRDGWVNLDYETFLQLTLTNR
ncbi:hypothetical protein RI367_000127 [Sorochytrium milnesiophthora]